MGKDHIQALRYFFDWESNHNMINRSVVLFSKQSNSQLIFTSVKLYKKVRVQGEKESVEAWWPKHH